MLSSIVIANFFTLVQVDDRFPDECIMGLALVCGVPVGRLRAYSHYFVRQQ